MLTSIGAQDPDDAGFCRRNKDWLVLQNKTQLFVTGLDHRAVETTAPESANEFGTSKETERRGKVGFFLRLDRLGQVRTREESATS